MATSHHQDVVVYVRPSVEIPNPSYYLHQMHSELTSSAGWSLRAVFVEEEPESSRARSDMIAFLSTHPEIVSVRVSENWSPDDDNALAEVGRYVRLHTTTGSWVPDGLRQYGR